MAAISLSAAQKSFTLLKSTCQQLYCRALWQFFFNRGFDCFLSRNNEIFHWKKKVCESAQQYGRNFKQLGAAFPLKKKKRERERLIREWLITWILYLIVCNKMEDGSRKVLPFICLLLLEYLLDVFLLPPPRLELNMVVVTHCNNSFASQEIGVLVSISAWGILHFTSSVFQRQLCLTWSISSGWNSLPNAAAWKAGFETKITLFAVSPVEGFSLLQSSFKNPGQKCSFTLSVSRLTNQIYRIDDQQAYCQQHSKKKSVWAASFGGVLWLRFCCCG